MFFIPIINITITIIMAYTLKNVTVKDLRVKDIILIGSTKYEIVGMVNISSKYIKKTSITVKNLDTQKNRLEIAFSDTIFLKLIKSIPNIESTIDNEIKILTNEKNMLTAQLKSYEYILELNGGNHTESINKIIEIKEKLKIKLN